MATSTDFPRKTAQSGVTGRAGTRDWLRIISIGLAIIGIFVSAVTSYAKLSGTVTPCLNQEAGFSCEVVQTSDWSYFPPRQLFGGGIPVAYLGLLGYAAIFGVLALETRVPFFARRGKLIVFFMTLGGFLFSGYLTAIEAFVLNEWCQWCIVSAVAMTLLFGVSFVRLWRDISAVPEDEEA